MSEEVLVTKQGTRLDETPPWMSYNDELNEKLDPQLEAEIEEYSKRRYADGETSSQTQEELHRQQELSEGVAKEYQWLHPNEYKEEGPRIGKVMTDEEFLTKVKRCAKGTRFWYSDHPQPRKLSLYYIRDGMASHDLACWVQGGYMPEYSFMRFDEHGVPMDEKRRGWRTCLLQMIIKGIVSEERAHKEFGHAHGPASERYNRTLYGWRNQHTE